MDTALVTFSTESDRCTITPDWQKLITDSYVTDLTIRYFDRPYVVDNWFGQYVMDPELKAEVAEAAK